MNHLRPEKENIKITLVGKFLITSCDCKSSIYGGGVIDEYTSEE
jgi:hypothetical protein